MTRTALSGPVCGASVCAEFGSALRRLRKDPLDTIDGGTKVALAFRRVTDPERAAKEERAKKEAEAAAAAQAAKASKKAGSWGGLPSRL